MNKKIYFFCLIFFFFFSKNIYANEITKIVFVDIDYLINNSTIGKQTLQNLEKLNNENVKILKEKESILINREKELKKKQNILSDNEIKKEVDDLKIQIAKFREEKNIIVKNSEKNRINELNKILDQFNKIIQEYMTENSIDIVLNKKNIFIGKVTSDITGIVLEKINNKLK